MSVRTIDRTPVDTIEIIVFLKEPTTTTEAERIGKRLAMLLVNGSGDRASIDNAILSDLRLGEET